MMSDFEVHIPDESSMHDFLVAFPGPVDSKPSAACSAAIASVLFCPASSSHFVSFYSDFFSFFDSPLQHSNYSGQKNGALLIPSL